MSTSKDIWAVVPIKELDRAKQRLAPLLSPAERRELVALLTALPAHMSYIIIEHDLDVALRVAERVTVMHNGHVLKHGTPAEIESDAEVQAIYIGGGHR